MEAKKTRKFEVDINGHKIRVLDFIENYLYIRPKPQSLDELEEESAPLVLFKLNPQQMQLYLKVEDDWCHYRPIRYAVLKARQIGFSTLISALIFVVTYFDPYKESLVIADIDDHTSRIFQMYQRYYDNLPYQIKMPLVTSKRGTQLSTKIESTISVETVSEDIGAGSTLKCIHASEFGLWRKQKEALAKLIASMPYSPNTMFFIESTAKGMNYFRELCLSALDGSNRMFKGHFAPWYENRGYQQPYHGEELTDEEESLLRGYADKGMTVEGLMWRRANIDAMGELMFHQEYPTYPDEAFLSTGICYFNSAKVHERLQQVLKEGYERRGYFTYNYRWSEDGKRVSVSNIDWQDDSEGNVKIYEEPLAGYPYTLGADTADGGRDYFTISVRRHDGNCRKQVATFCCQKMDADQFAFSVYCLGRYYNNALCAIEANRGGRCNSVLARTGYPKIYVRQSIQRFDEMPVNSYGFFTEGSNKEDICNGLRSRFREFPQEFKDVRQLEEMLTFVILAVGSRGHYQLGAATPSDHDDTVLADAICLAVGETNQQTTWVNTEKAKESQLPWQLRENKVKKTEGGSLWRKSIIS